MFGRKQSLMFETHRLGVCTECLFADHCFMLIAYGTSPVELLFFRNRKKSNYEFILQFRIKSDKSDSIASSLRLLKQLIITMYSRYSSDVVLHCWNVI